LPDRIITSDKIRITFESLMMLPSTILEADTAAVRTAAAIVLDSYRSLVRTIPVASSTVLAGIVDDVLN
jgi:hypothetical protein